MPQFNSKVLLITFKTLHGLAPLYIFTTHKTKSEISQVQVLPEQVHFQFLPLIVFHALCALFYPVLTDCLLVVYIAVAYIVQQLLTNPNLNLFFSVYVK